MAENMAGLYKQIMKGHYPQISKHYSPELAHTIKGLLEHNPYSRPSIEEVATSTAFLKWEEEIWPSHQKKNHWLKKDFRSSLIKTIYKTQSTENKTNQETQASTIKDSS